MTRFTAFRRAAAVAGATGLIAISLAGPAAARDDHGTGTVQRCTSDCYDFGSTPIATTQDLPLDDNAVEYLQLGAGLLAGVALAGAGMALASRRGHGRVVTHA